MLSFYLLTSFTSLILLLQPVTADCQSGGTDYVNNGGPYCVNSVSEDYFSFGTEFQGCAPSDTQGDVIPIVIGPDSDEYYCSNISTQPDMVERRSTCNVTDFELRKDNMASGGWIIVTEGLTFAKMRQFVVNAVPPVVVTSTPTATYTIPTTPIVTSTSTTTYVATTTLTPATITVPSTIKTRTVYITPKPITTTTISLFTISQPAWVNSRTTKTVTVSSSCNPAPQRWDPKATIRPKLARLAAVNIDISINVPLLGGILHRSQRKRDPAWARAMREEAKRHGLLDERAVDACTTTVLATTNIPSVTITITAPTSTLVIPTDTTSTLTVTPSATTIFNGKASTTITVTRPAQTITKIQRGITTTRVTRTIWATITTTVKARPTGGRCNGS